jgi:hypothetical protein
LRSVATCSVPLFGVMNSPPDGDSLPPLRRWPWPAYALCVAIFFGLVGLIATLRTAPNAKISEQAGTIGEQERTIQSLTADRDSWKKLAEDRNRAKYKGSRYFEVLGRFFEEIESEDGRLEVFQVVRVTQEDESQTVRLGCGVACLLDIQFDGLVNVPTRSERVVRVHRIERRAGRNEDAPIETTEHLLARAGCAFRTPVDILYAVAVVTLISLDEVEIVVVAARIPKQPKGHVTGLFGAEPADCGVSPNPPAAAPPPS